jgi:hypothetical protein
MLKGKDMSEYLYSWNDSAPEGYRQTIKDGKVIECINFPIEEAKRLYYATRSKAMQAYDNGLEAAAGEGLKRVDNKC